MERAASFWLAALLFLSLLLLYVFDHNYYATYFELFFGWKGFGLLELALRGGREGLDTRIWREMECPAGWAPSVGGGYSVICIPLRVVLRMAAR